MDATEYDHDDLRELVSELADVLGHEHPTGITAIWHADGPHIAVRADHIHELVHAARRLARYEGLLVGETMTPDQEGHVSWSPRRLRYVRLTGTNRDALRNWAQQRYGKGQSIRELAEEMNRSYGFAHQLLKEANVRFRGRGGGHYGKSV